MLRMGPEWGGVYRELKKCISNKEKTKELQQFLRHVIFWKF